MKVFFAVTMYMSIVKQTVLREYWDEGFYGSDLVKRHFTVHRFEAILSNLHFADPKTRPEPMVHATPKPATHTASSLITPPFTHAPDDADDV